MSTLNPFDYERFLFLSGLELCKWMERLPLDDSLHLSKDLVPRLARGLPAFEDEYYLVYRLESQAHFAPEVTVKEVPKYLAHRSG